MRLPLILLIRHGETDWNAAHRYQGQTDIPLNDKGRAQAARNGLALADWFAREGRPAREFHFLASPLLRASETLAIVRRHLGLAPEDAFARDARLMEANYGVWEGLTVAEIEARDPTGFKRRNRDPLGFAPEGGESYGQVAERAFAALAELDKPTVLVCHGGVTKVIRGRVLGLPPKETIHLPVPQDRIWRIENGQVDAF
jgi:probable phosphoglycerate mutase